MLLAILEQVTILIPILYKLCVYVRIDDAFVKYLNDKNLTHFEIFI